jgi:hypothetical protein
VLCLDCAVDTLEIGHYYMVCDELWAVANPDIKGMLCFDCLEGRLGRRLVVSDFEDDVPINFDIPEQLAARA